MGARSYPIVAEKMGAHGGTPLQLNAGALRGDRSPSQQRDYCEIALPWFGFSPPWAIIAKLKANHSPSLIAASQRRSVSLAQTEQARQMAHARDQSEDCKPDERLVLHNLVKRDPRTGLAEDVRSGLTARPKRFLPKYFYDELGSQLFDAICLLPEYYLTRAENKILQRYAEEIAASVEGQKTLVEMGSGSASKTRLVIEALLREQSELVFMPVDISATALENSSRILLQSYPRLKIEAYAADYFAGLAESERNNAAGRSRSF